MEITSRNTNTLAPAIYGLLQRNGALDQSRNGPVLRLLEPITICLTNPRERVNFCPVRDANPFFHLIEGCAMLANYNSIPFLSYFAKQMAEYSDNGQTQNAFYGTRLRSTWGDQLNAVISNLRADPHSRREVALIWNPEDLTKSTKDKACNVMLMFAIDSMNRVNMTSINRSNDAIWGMVNGANIVHLSMIHEYVACSVGRHTGYWWHFSNNFHVYTDNPKWDKIKNVEVKDAYTLMRPAKVPLFRYVSTDFGEQKNLFDAQLRATVLAMSDATMTGSSLVRDDDALPFVSDLVFMFNAYQAHKTKSRSLHGIIHILENVQADDWRWAAEAWMIRRYEGGAK